MSIPGFTANASLYKSSQQYRLSATGTLSTTSVVPQQQGDFGACNCDDRCCRDCFSRLEQERGINCEIGQTFCGLICRNECCPPITCGSCRGFQQCSDGSFRPCSC